MLIALDANVWIAERMLRSAIGVAFLHAVRTLDHRILLPDVTRDEVLSGVVRQGEEAVRKVETGLVTVQALTGTRPQWSTPTPENFRTAAEQRLDEIGDMLLSTVAALDHYRKAVMRLHAHRPPSATKEQFRDSVLWEVLLSELKGRNAALITQDRDFINAEASLRQEAEQAIALHSSLADYLDTLKGDMPPVDFTGLVEPISALVLSTIAPTLPRAGAFTLDARKASRVRVFATETVDALAVEFEITFMAHELTLYDGTMVPAADITFVGDCVQNARTGEVSQPNMHEVNATDSAGHRIPFGVLYARGTAGASDIPYRVRQQLYSGGVT